MFTSHVSGVENMRLSSEYSRGDIERLSGKYSICIERFSGEDSRGEIEKPSGRELERLSSEETRLQHSYCELWPPQLGNHH